MRSRSESPFKFRDLSPGRSHYFNDKPKFNIFYNYIANILAPFDILSRCILWLIPSDNFILLSIIFFLPTLCVILMVSFF